MGIPADEAAAVNHVGLALEDRPEQPGELARIVFKVGVLHDDEVAPGVGEAGVQGGALAAILRLQHQLVDQRPQRALQQVARAVGGAVVHHDDFQRQPRLRGVDRLQDFFDRAQLVVAWHYNGQDLRLFHNPPR